VANDFFEKLNMMEKEKESNKNPFAER